MTKKLQAIIDNHPDLRDEVRQGLQGLEWVLRASRSDLKDELATQTALYPEIPAGSPQPAREP